MEEHKLLKAYWRTRYEGVVELDQDWFLKTRQPPLFLNNLDNPLRKIKKLSPFEFAELSGYCTQGGEIIFVLSPKVFENYDVDRQKIYVGGSFNGWDKAIGQEKWQLRPEKINGNVKLTLHLPPGTCFKTGKSLFKFVTENKVWLEVPWDAPNVSFCENNIRNFSINPLRTGHHVFSFEKESSSRLLHGEKILWSSPNTSDECIVDYSGFLLSLKSDKELGAIVDGDKTTFRLFAPRASHVIVSIYSQLPAKTVQQIELQQDDDGVWEVDFLKNLHGHYYHYTVKGENLDKFSAFDETVQILDPYALAAADSKGPGIIIDRAQATFPFSDFTPPHWHDLVIMEAHVRDLLTHAPIDLTPEERRGFSGLTKWLQSEDCYLRETGINAVELQPIQEFDNICMEEYHWGYMTSNYFSPESSYAKNPSKASQVVEFQELVESFHRAGIAVIVDVVYNHVGEPNFLLFIDKRYYFEINSDGYLMNWSGCGNDLRTHAPMCRRLIIDSLINLMRMYHVDGFRFDLAELLGMEVLLDIEKALKKENPNVILIAEPWSFRSHMGPALRKTGFAFWNDGYRDFLAKYVHGQGNQEGIRYFLRGSLDYQARFPCQSVNYTESHDDRCWIDKITENPNFLGENPTAQDRRRTHLMIATLMMSLGMPMIAEGQDLLRSKQSENNTYKRGDLNALSYFRALNYPSTADYFRQWIRFRRSDNGQLLRLEALPSANYIKFFHQEGFSSVATLYNADFSLTHTNQQLLFAINPHKDPISFHIPDVDLTQFTQIADIERFSPQGLPSSNIPLNSTSFTLPGLSCALWVR